MSNQHKDFRRRKREGEYINFGRPAYVDAMVERADEEPGDIKLQRSMLNGRVPHLTRTERKRFAARVRRSERRWKKKLKRTGVPDMVEGIDELLTRY